MNQGMYQEEESFPDSQTLKFSIEYGFRIVSHCCLQNCRSIETESPILYFADNTMTDVKSRPPCVISCVTEWPLR